ncbi:GNAT family N-acetyltransferase [Metabacillus iocasae]|uniref:Ribosomal protein S18 acetylase RimI-like enzyme n=1 Tax=Priestia iocasae TaxID=2291674 RepID=A0ABS2QU05_9BACI|nr:GNAT family N-acetyltransferase [Metabacillus iocasae]MBM7702955.1 ribosomal protein S18 acetylase RimI-like enzyme [Metabacillus iocasae]
MNKELNVTISSNKEEAKFIRESLISFNKSKVPYTEEEKINLVIKNEQNQIVGGLLGRIDWKCFFIDILWVDDSLRGLGKGKELMQLAEEVAYEKGCNFIRLETFSFQAPDFYKSLGYEVLGKLENFPEGFDHYYLYKRLKNER